MPVIVTSASFVNNPEGMGSEDLALIIKDPKH